MGEDFKDRLERLHDSRRRADERADEARGAGVYRADDVDERQPGDDSSPSVEGEPDFPGAQPISNDEGRAFRRRHRHDPGTSYGSVTLGHARRHASFDVFAPHVDRADALPSHDSTVAYLDTETTGLDDSSYAFCVGIGKWDGGDFVVTHHLIAHPDQESAMLADVGRALDGVDLVCSFNGDNYDLPLLERRADEVDVPSPTEEVGSLDLLPVARGTVELDSHTLQDLERHCLGRTRHDDIPGAEIPSRWNDFRQSTDDASPDAEPLEPVLEHNRLDVVALAALAFDLGRRLVRSTSDEPNPTSRRRASPSSPDSSEADEHQGGEEGEERSAPERDPETSGVASKLERTYRLRNRSGRRDGDSKSPDTPSEPTPSSPEDGSDDGRPTTSPPRRSDSRESDARDEEPDKPPDGDTGGTPPDAATRADTAPPSPDTDTSPGERVAELRRRAGEHLNAGRLDRAVPLLREILALKPRHPFALEKLASYHRRAGRHAFAEHYEARLEDVSPF